MSWELHGPIMDDDGQHSDEQVGKAASVRFVNPDLPGRLVTIYAYPHAPEMEILTKEGSVETFYGFTHDLDSLGIEVMTEFMICQDVEEPGSTEKWSDLRYTSLDTSNFESNVFAAETAAYVWISLRQGRDIDWNGERF